ncbi:transmembrane protein 252 [Odocoileus virginianus]|uniref:Transmembrane protein 252 n=1 Tax=Odocoileus virginianus TaxID=9874 RepID=A0A6J0Z2B2_ODOVR
MQNRTCLVLCVFVLLTGFLMICLGAFFISSPSLFNCQGNLTLAYLLLPLGFVILLSGIFWSTYYQASESKGVFKRVLRQCRAQGALPLATVDRPGFYPPAYEESLAADKQACRREQETSGAPPPPYSEMGLGFQGEDGAHPEAPPPCDEPVADRVAAARPRQDAQRRSQEC